MLVTGVAMTALLYQSRVLGSAQSACAEDVHAYCV